MNLGNPSNTRIVVYFFLLTLVLAFLSMTSPASFGEVREIPQSPSWGDPVATFEVPPLVKLPSCTVDSQGNVHIVYYDKTDDQIDLFYAKINDGIILDHRNVTNYPSLKESATADTDSSGTLYVAFLDNRGERWQVFFLNITEDKLIQITDTNTHKEDVFLSIGPDNIVVITWTEIEEGIPHIIMAVMDVQGNIFVKKHVSDYSSTKASTVVDAEKIHVMYLEKHVYDRVVYAQVDFSGELLTAHDLGECIHKEAVSPTGSLGIFKGPQFVVADNITCIWSDFRTGSHSLFYTEFTESGEVIVPGKLTTDHPLRGWSWMPSIGHHDGIIHIAYLNNGFGSRIFHSRFDRTYQELGAITSERERATAPVLVSDDKGFLHCVYLRFKEGNMFDLVYKNTYPPERKEVPVSERMEESSVRYVHSFALSFLYSFPLAFKNNFWGICLLAAGFFIFHFFKLEKHFAKWKRSEYLLLGAYIAVLSLLRGPIEYSFLALAIYETTFIIYGFILSVAASFVFKYLLMDRFDYEARVLLSCLVFLYLFTFFLLLPVIPHM